MIHNRESIIYIQHQSPEGLDSVPRRTFYGLSPIFLFLSVSDIADMDFFTDHVWATWISCCGSLPFPTAQICRIMYSPIQNEQKAVYCCFNTLLWIFQDPLPLSLIYPFPFIFPFMLSESTYCILDICILSVEFFTSKKIHCLSADAGRVGKRRLNTK